MKTAYIIVVTHEKDAVEPQYFGPYAKQEDTFGDARSLLERWGDEFIVTTCEMMQLWT